MSSSKNPYKYEQKKINHIFHYTAYFPDLESIIRKGFIPSYCKEEIANKNYLTPMVSFCNIPIGEVDKYMRYGKNGIGMSLEWAIKYRLSPVTYTHQNSPYQGLLNSLSLMNLHVNLNDLFERNPKNFLDYEMMDDLALDQKSLVYKANLALLQYLKNWETDYKGEKIITYQEREWRYVPTHKNIRPLIEENDSEFVDYTENDKKPKPHLPEFPLKIENISDIKYIVVTTEKQVDSIIKTLFKKFSEKDTTHALLQGKLSILTASQIRNDF